MNASKFRVSTDQGNSRHLAHIEMSFLPKAQVDQLKAFVALLRSKPDIIHDPALDFFREFLVRLATNKETPVWLP